MDCPENMAHGLSTDHASILCQPSREVQNGGQLTKSAFEDMRSRVRFDGNSAVERFRVSKLIERSGRDSLLNIPELSKPFFIDLPEQVSTENDLRKRLRSPNWRVEKEQLGSRQKKSFAIIEEPQLASEPVAPCIRQQVEEEVNSSDTTFSEELNYDLQSVSFEGPQHFVNGRKIGLNALLGRASKRLNHQEEPSARHRQMSQHDIFLSHSGQEKSFVEQLCYDLKRMNQRPFFDQDSDCLQKAERFAPAILEAAKQCRVGVVVVSEGYLTSKWPMLELSKFVECGVPVFPLFLKLSPSDLKSNEVETKWKQSWRQLVERGEVEEEVVELWSKAVKELRSSNGLEFRRYANSEYKYRSAVVEEIYKKWPPILEWSMDMIQGCERLCEVTLSMFMEAKVEGEDGSTHMNLGIYGTGGLGKTTLCKSMCSYFLGEFGGRVLHLELPSEEAIDWKTGEQRLARLKRVFKELAMVDKSVLESIWTEEQGWACLEDRLRDMPPVFLAIDNVGESAASREEAQRYVKIKLPSGSKVLVTARSREVINVVLGKVEFCKPMPRLDWEEATALFLSYAAPNISSVSCLIPKERESVEKCLSQCRFLDGDYPSKQYHPLVLRALGTYFHDVGNNDVMSWGEALESWTKGQGRKEVASVNDILGLSYRHLSDQMKLIFLDSVLYYRILDIEVFTSFSEFIRLRFDEFCSPFEMWASWISEVHDVSLFEAKGMVRRLERLSLVEVSSKHERGLFVEGLNLKVSVHDLYKEFARALVEVEGSKERHWWNSRSSDQTQLKRLVLKKDRGVGGVTPTRFLEWQCLVLLDLWKCKDVGPDLELKSFHSLRALYVDSCPNVKRILCSCDKDNDDGVCCYERNRGLGCMSELLTVRLDRLRRLQDIPFLRHCWNLQQFSSRILKSYYLNTQFSRYTHSECNELLSSSFLQGLESCVSDDYDTVVGDGDAFMRWLHGALQLKNLTVLGYVVCGGKAKVKKVLSSYTLDLNEVVGLSRRLSKLCVSLPWEVKEVKGLHLLSELIVLSLYDSKGLRHLPDLQCLPKLKYLCVHGCCQLEGSPSVGPEVQPMHDNPEFISNIHGFHQCLDPRCHKNPSDEFCPLCHVDCEEGSAEHFGELSVDDLSNLLRTTVLAPLDPSAEGYEELVENGLRMILEPWIKSFVKRFLKGPENDSGGS